MKSKILDSSYVVDFMNEGFNSDQICQLIQSETDEILTKLNKEILNDWKIYFAFIYNNTRGMLIYRTAGSYPVEKYKEITTHIPIPTTDSVSWGVTDNQYVQKIGHLDNKAKNFDHLDVDFLQFENRQDYIIDCMRRAIKFCFNNGFTISGVKVKIDYK